MLEALRTPYGIDVLQPVYYVLDSFRQLAELSEWDLLAMIDEARELGLLSAPKARGPRNDSNSLRTLRPAL